VYDDASPSRLGEQMAQHFTGRGARRVDVLRAERSTGYRGAIDRTLTALGWIARCGRGYDYVLRVDADTHFCRTGLGALFQPGRLPPRGIVGQTLQMRRKDAVQILLDELPAGFRRARDPNGDIMHQWQLSRGRPVWWHDIGVRALAHGFRGTIVPGCFVIIAAETLLAISSAGWLDRPRQSLGLVFGEDVMISILTKALGHPITDARTLIPDWSCELGLRPDTSAQIVEQRRYYFIHPLKDVEWANALRQALPLRP